MGYIVSSLLSVGKDDPHRSFIYYLPTRRFAYQWINDWIYQQFHEVAARLGPDAVLIAPPPGRDRYRDWTPESLIRGFSDALEGCHEGSTEFLHTGLPFLVVSRRPVRPGDDPAPFAAINLASLDETKLLLLFDILIEAASEGADLVDRIPDLGSKLVRNDLDDDADLFDQAIEIKPSIFGIGLNGNVLLEWLRQRRARRDREKEIVPTEGE